MPPLSANDDDDNDDGGGGDDDDDDDDDNNHNNNNNNNNNNVECKNKGDTSNNWSDWNHFQIIQKIRERHTRKP
jgi:hypothetical protein